MHSRASRALALALAVSLLGHAPVFALPTGWEVVSGDVTFDQQGNTLNVTSSTPQAIVNYQSFNIGQGELVNFLLPGSMASILNRVVGGGATTILGSITSNGQIILVNPAGIHIGNTAQINTGAFLASTLGLSNTDYLNGAFKFNRDGQAGTVENHGSIHTTGIAALLGAGVKNTGSIQGSTVALAVGDEITLELGNGTSARLVVTEALKQQAEDLAEVISNTGTIDAHTAQLIAKLEQTVYDTVINQKGIIRATAVGENHGRIELYGESADGSMLVKNSGTLDASGADGGHVSMTGDVVEQAGLLLANADEGGTGGTIDIVSKDFTDLKAGSKTLANAAGATGHGGNIYIWSDNDTILRRGGLVQANAGADGGDGGFVELSAKNDVQWNGWMEAVAPNGKAGTVLLDPTNILVSSAGGGDISDDPNAANPDVGTGTCATGNVGNCTQTANDFFVFNNLYLLATSSITVESDILMMTPGATVKLEVGNGGQITVNSNNPDPAVKANIWTQDGQVDLIAPDGTITIGTQGGITTNGSGTTGANVNITGFNQLNFSGTIEAGTTGAVTLTAGPGASNININGGGLNAASISGTGINMDADSITIGGANGASIDARTGDLTMTTQDTLMNIVTSSNSTLRGQNINFNGGVDLQGSIRATNNLTIGRNAFADLMLIRDTHPASTNIHLRGTGNKDIRGTLQATNNLTLDGNIVSNAGGTFSPQLIADSDSSGTGTLTLNGTVSYDDDNLTLDGALVDFKGLTGPLYDMGTGTLTVLGPSQAASNITLRGSSLIMQGTTHTAVGVQYVFDGPIVTNNHAVSFIGNGAGSVLDFRSTVNTGNADLVIDAGADGQILLPAAADLTGNNVTITAGSGNGTLGADITAAAGIFYNATAATQMDMPNDLTWQGQSISITNGTLNPTAGNLVLNLTATNGTVHLNDPISNGAANPLRNLVVNATGNITVQDDVLVDNRIDLTSSGGGIVRHAGGGVLNLMNVGGDGVYLSAHTTIGSNAAPLGVSVAHGVVQVTASNSDGNGNSVVMSGLIQPTDTLSVQGSPPGNVIYNGNTLHHGTAASSGLPPSQNTFLDNSSPNQTNAGTTLSGALNSLGQATSNLGNTQGQDQSFKNNLPPVNNTNIPQNPSLGDLFGLTQEQQQIEHLREIYTTSLNGGYTGKANTESNLIKLKAELSQTTDPQRQAELRSEIEKQEVLKGLHERTIQDYLGLLAGLPKRPSNPVTETKRAELEQQKAFGQEVLRTFDQAINEKMSELNQLVKESNQLIGEFNQLERSMENLDRRRDMVYDLLEGAKLQLILAKNQGASSAKIAQLERAVESNQKLWDSVMEENSALTQKAISIRERAESLKAKQQQLMSELADLEADRALFSGAMAGLDTQLSQFPPPPQAAAPPPSNNNEPIYTTPSYNPNPGMPWPPPK